jgi:hypothetical protein
MSDEPEEQDFTFEEEVPANLDEIDGVPVGTFYDIRVESLKVFKDDANKPPRLNLRLKVLGPTHEGESFFIGYAMPFPNEHAFARNQRMAFCQDTGLIGKEDQGQAKRIDYGRLRGAEFTVEYESSPNKKDPSKPYKQIAFHGWHPMGWRPGDKGAPAATSAPAGEPVAAAAAAKKPANFDDI